MWDAIGKMLGQPIYNLLGGPVRDKLRFYANGWAYGLTRPTDYAAAAEKLVARGFDALKFDPLPKPWRTFIGADHMRAGEEVLATVRKAVGPDVDLLIDNHRRLAPMHAVEMAMRYEKYRIYWFEEPCQAHNLDAMRYIRGKIATPVVTGEELYSKSAFRPVFEHAAADIINPDVCNVGGILELRDIAAMAEPYLVGVSPHNYNSTSVSLAATVQASVVMPNFVIGEYFVPFEEVSKRITPDALRPINGIIDVPTGPGLGVTVDEAFLRAHRRKPSPARQFATLHSRVL
jgi:galactonate dehydratase